VVLHVHESKVNKSEDSTTWDSAMNPIQAIP
jgi:hypothetical protein